MEKTMKKNNQAEIIESQDQAGCATCPVHHAANLKKLGVDMGNWDFVVALAGNPNTGKSTVFNALTGLRQHTGNWPGKTVTRAEGGFDYGENRYKLVDLPGTYSLLATSLDEEIARDFILFGQPDVTVVVVDATRLERNLNLVDEAERHNISVDHRRLARDLGVPVVPTIARYDEGLEDLLAAISEVASGETQAAPYHVKYTHPKLDQAVTQLVKQIEESFPDVPNARWVALRLLDGDEKIIEAVKNGDLGELTYTIEELGGHGVDTVALKSGFSL